MVEYWAHVQAFMPVDLWPVMRHRMARYRDERHKWWGSVVHRPSSSTSLLARGRRPRRLDGARPRRRRCRAQKAHWGWNWSTSRAALDYLFMVGDVAIAGRNSQFEVRYDLPERVLPPSTLDGADARPSTRPTKSWSAGPPGRTASPPLRDLRRLLPAALQPRPEPAGAAAAVDELVEDGELLPVTVEGVAATGLPPPRRARSRAGSAPAPCSARSTRWSGSGSAPSALFDFHYRIEIYVPGREAQSTATTCCRSCSATGSSAASTSRPTGRPGCCWSRRRTPSPARPPRPPRSWPPSCERLAGWLGLHTVVVEPRGDLAPALSTAVAAADDRRGGARANRPGSGRWVELARVHPTSTTGSPPVPAIIDKLLRIGEGKILRQLEAISRAVNAIEDDFVAMTDDELRAQTDEFKERLADGRDARRPDARGVRHRARGGQAGARPAALRRADHGRRGAAPRQHRRDEDR